MRTLFFMGRNERNKSGVSWKIWKIERHGRSVTTLWGPARLRKRQVLPAGALQSNTVRFTSLDTAADYEATRINSKLRKGYERRPRTRSR